MPSAPSVTAGIDLGGTKIQTVIVRARKVAGADRVLTPAMGPDEVIDAIVGTVAAALAGAGATRADLKGLGIGTPGTVNGASGVVSRSSNVPGFLAEVPLGPRLSSALSG